MGAADKWIAAVKRLKLNRVQQENVRSVRMKKNL